MSDVEPLVLREQPPVEHPVERPERFSQTFVKHADRCLRSAYLYLRHKGGAASHELHRGTAFHLFMERVTRLLMETENERIPGELAKDLMLEVLMENPELQVPQDEQDRLRMMAWHVSQGLWLRRPWETTIAVERKFVLEVGPWLVSGKVDYAWLDEGRAGIWDYKTSFLLPDQATFEAGVQLPLYACGLAFGKLVREEPCFGCNGTGKKLNDEPGPEYVKPCPSCNGRGKTETLEPWPILENAQEFELAEIYPAYLWDTGLAQRVTTISRADLLDWQLALGATLNRVEHAFESGRWDAMPGHPQCGECPAAHECPLPARARNYAGAINTPEQAVEAALWWEQHKDRPAAVKKELKAFAGRPGGGPIRYGSNLILDFSTGKKRKVDTDGLVDAALRAANYGEPFDPDEFITVQHPLEFKRRVLSKQEIAAEAAERDGNGADGNGADVTATAGADSAAGPGAAGESPWGDAAPF